MKKKPQAAPAAIAIAADQDQVLEVPLAKIEPHPDNPGRARITAASVAELAADLETNGQLQPITLRPQPSSNGAGPWQIIFGERRYQAARRLNWKTIRATVRPADDATALALQGAENGQRVDIDPISRARHLAKMTAEQADGSTPLTQQEAGRLYGLTSQSAVSNLVRLLKLPKIWRERIASGELSARAARALVPYAHANALMQVFDAHYKRKYPWDAEAWKTYEELAPMLERWAREETRPMDKRRKHNYGWPAGDHGRYFEPTDAQRKRLQIVSLPLGRGKKGVQPPQVEVATNAKLWDKLNRPGIEAAKAKREAARVRRSASGRPIKPKTELTGNAAKRYEREKAAQREKDVWQIVLKLRHRLLRCGLAQQLNPDDARVGAVLPWICTRFAYCGELRRPLTLALKEVAGADVVPRLESEPAGAKQSLQAKWPADLIDRAEDPVDAVDRLHAALLRLFLWPTSQHAAAASQGFGLTYTSHPAPGWKDPLIPLPHGTLDDWCTWPDKAITFATEWRRAGWDPAQRAIVRQALEQHRKAELAALAAEWKLDHKATAAKPELVEAILAAHTREKSLPLPKAWRKAK